VDSHNDFFRLNSYLTLGEVASIFEARVRALGFGCDPSSRGWLDRSVSSNRRENNNPRRRKLLLRPLVCAVAPRDRFEAGPECRSQLRLLTLLLEGVRVRTVSGRVGLPWRVGVSSPPLTSRSGYYYRDRRHCGPMITGGARACGFL